MSEASNRSLPFGYIYSLGETRCSALAPCWHINNWAAGTGMNSNWPRPSGARAIYSAIYIFALPPRAVLYHESSCGYFWRLHMSALRSDHAQLIKHPFKSWIYTYIVLYILYTAVYYSTSLGRAHCGYMCLRHMHWPCLLYIVSYLSPYIAMHATPANASSAYYRKKLQSWSVIVNIIIIMVCFITVWNP